MKMWMQGMAGWLLSGAMAAAVANTAVQPTPKLEGDCYDWYQRHEDILAAKDKIQPEVVMIGDSITHFWDGLPFTTGSRVVGPKSWAKLFGDKKVLNLGYGWDRTQNVLWRLDHGEFDGLKPKWVVVNIGTNNSSGTSHAPENTPGETAEGVQKILDTVTAKSPDSKIILMGIFPRGAESSDPKRTFVKELNLQLAKIAEEKKFTFIDLSAKFLQPDGKLPVTLMSDGVHPTEEGYAIWADALEKAMK